MMTRDEAIAFFESQLRGSGELKGDRHINLELGPRIDTYHYGRCELYDLMDAIYGEGDERSILHE